MSAKYTPGPWRVGRWPEIVATDERKTLVCEVSGAMNNPQAIADAQLISAAPELLESLEETLWEMESLMKAKECIYQGGINISNRARAAIAKAIGKEEA